MIGGFMTFVVGEKKIHARVVHENVTHEIGSDCERWHGNKSRLTYVVNGAMHDHCKFLVFMHLWTVINATIMFLCICGLCHVFSRTVSG